MNTRVIDAFHIPSYLGNYKFNRIKTTIKTQQSRQRLNHLVIIYINTIRIMRERNFRNLRQRYFYRVTNYKNNVLKGSGLSHNDVG